MNISRLLDNGDLVAPAVARPNDRSQDKTPLDRRTHARSGWGRAWEEEEEEEEGSRSTDLYEA
jgi:hypothetical protein